MICAAVILALASLASAQDCNDMSAQPGCSPDVPVPGGGQVVSLDPGPCRFIGLDIAGDRYVQTGCGFAIHPANPYPVEISFETQVVGVWLVAVTVTGGTTYSAPPLADGSYLIGDSRGISEVLVTSDTGMVCPSGFGEVTIDDLCVGPPPTLCGLCGDCDNSAAVTILDALLAAQVASGGGGVGMLEPECCDVDSSGQITVIDALLIAQQVVGLPVALVCP